MSARAYDRSLKVARTIADLEGCADVLDHHIMGAHQHHRNLVLEKNLRLIFNNTLNSTDKTYSA